MIANLGRKETQKAALTSPWAVLMVSKSVSLWASIYYLYYQKLDKQSTALYGDEGLVLLRNTSKEKTDRIRKDVLKSLKTLVLKSK